MQLARHCLQPKDPSALNKNEFRSWNQLKGFNFGNTMPIQILSCTPPWKALTGKLQWTESSFVSMGLALEKCLVVLRP